VAAGILVPVTVLGIAVALWWWKAAHPALPWSALVPKTVANAFKPSSLRYAPLVTSSSAAAGAGGDGAAVPIMSTGGYGSTATSREALRAGFAPTTSAASTERLKSLASIAGGSYGSTSSSAGVNLGPYGGGSGADELAKGRKGGGGYAGF